MLIHHNWQVVLMCEAQKESFVIIGWLYCTIRIKQKLIGPLARQAQDWKTETKVKWKQKLVKKIK